MSAANRDVGLTFAVAMMLYGAIALRYGRKLAGPSYTEQEMLKILSENK